MFDARWLLVASLFWGINCSPGCKSGEATLSQPEAKQIEKKYTANQVAEVRSKTDIDQRTMQIDGVLSIGTTGHGDDDAWIQVICQSEASLQRAQESLGDEVEGIPIQFALSDTIRAQ